MNSLSFHYDNPKGSNGISNLGRHNVYEKSHTYKLKSYNMNGPFEQDVGRKIQFFAKCISARTCFKIEVCV